MVDAVRTPHLGLVMATVMAVVIVTVMVMVMVLGMVMVMVMMMVMVQQHTLPSSALLRLLARSSGASPNQTVCMLLSCKVKARSE
jgi:hypothetical protein